MPTMQSDTSSENTAPSGPLSSTGMYKYASLLEQHRPLVSCDDKMPCYRRKDRALPHATSVRFKVGVNVSRCLRLFGREIIFEVFQPM